MTPHQIWLKELAEDTEQLREEFGIFLKMRNNPEMTELRDELTGIIQQLMTLLSQEREEINGEE
jgi:hypothetical protein